MTASNLVRNWLYLSAAGPGPWSLDARRGN
jgi:hypothetical protein